MSIAHENVVIVVVEPAARTGPRTVPTALVRARLAVHFSSEGDTALSPPRIVPVAGGHAVVMF